MKKGILLFSGLLLSTALFGQTFNKKYFARTAWFSNNKDSTFYKADTLKLIRYSTPAPEWASNSPNEKQYAEFEMKYLNTGDYVAFGFDTNKKMHLKWIKRNYMGTIPAGQWTWTFDGRTNVVSFYDWKKELVYSFRPVSERKVKIESRYEEHKELLTTIELTIVRVK